jgi:hypothetical protein
MTPIEVLKMLKSKIDEAEFYKSNYVLQTNDVEAINQALRIHDVVGRSEQLLALDYLTEKGITGQQAKTIAEWMEDFKSL